MIRRLSLLTMIMALALMPGAAIHWVSPGLSPVVGMARAQEAAAGQAMRLPADPDNLVVHTAQGEFPFSIEIADDPSERSRGLMFREEMPARHGMLFDFGATRQVNMWMKNTPMSLDMVFIGKDGIVVNVAERTEPFSEAVISSAGPVDYVLELRAGIAKLIGLKAGDRLEHRIFQ